MHFILSIDLGVMLLGVIGAYFGLFVLSMFKTWREGLSCLDECADFFDDLMMLEQPWLIWFVIAVVIVLPASLLAGFIFAGSNSLLLAFGTAAFIAALIRVFLSYMLFV